MAIRDHIETWLGIPAVRLAADYARAHVDQLRELVHAIDQDTEEILDRVTLAEERLAALEARAGDVMVGFAPESEIEA